MGGELISVSGSSPMLSGTPGGPCGVSSSDTRENAPYYPALSVPPSESSCFALYVARSRTRGEGRVLLERKHPLRKGGEDPRVLGIVRGSECRARPASPPLGEPPSGVFEAGAEVRVRPPRPARWGRDRALEVGAEAGRRACSTILRRRGDKSDRSPQSTLLAPRRLAYLEKPHIPLTPTLREETLSIPSLCLCAEGVRCVNKSSTSEKSVKEWEAKEEDHARGK